MKKFLIAILTFLFLNSLKAQTHKIIESTSEFIKMELNFENAYQIKENEINNEKFYVIEGKEIFLRNPGEPWLPNYILNIGIPYNSTPALKILSSTQEKKQKVFILPTPDSLNQPFDLLPFERKIYDSNSFFPTSAILMEDYIARYAHITNLSISPYQFNPTTRELLFNKKLVIQIDFNNDPNSIFNKIDDNLTDNILKSSVINYDVAKNFIGKSFNYSSSPEVQDTFWYNPQKDYFKIYLNKEGVYRITYDYLVNAGVPASGLQNNRLELFCNGESIPIDVIDENNDGFFNSGDYFQFVGKPAKPSDQYTRMNIYNLSNVYWFSYQADSLDYYKSINGAPTGSSPFITNSIKTLKWEKDLTFQRFGHANNGNRDYWHWGIAEARNRMPGTNFVYFIEDSIANNFVQDKPQVQLRVGMHGLTDISCDPGDGHNATIKLNTKPVGSISWDGTNSVEFHKNFYLALVTNLGGDTVQLFDAEPQKFEVEMNGDICDTIQNDIILVNYIELDLWRWNRTFPNYFYFSSPPDDFGENRYYLWRWRRDNMKIYIPSRGEIIPNPTITNDNDLSVWFQDTVYERTNYYCVADDYYLLPDSIRKSFSNSDLRNTTTGADYIIITHPDFLEAAETLAQFRSSNLSGYPSPRIKVVDIFDIYKEFSFGLLDPLALKYFAKYTFENWQEPAPAFITLIGDASFDYRLVYQTSDKNYIPSIPFHGYTFGYLPSDNSIVAVAGTDLTPDIAIGRLSCQTSEEANILINKIINYPSDNSKQWKENVILLASGLNYEDQIRLQFNNKAKILETSNLLPNGIYTTKVFNYPEPPDIAFLGGGPRMREEINKGAAVVSYYGHGGGGQWDLIFTKDNIPELNNGNRLPFISSITCYTAHFDNAESFGELFNKIPGKGSIGYWGSVSLTWWPTGHEMNNQLFNKIFNNRNYVIGSAILGTLSGGFSQMIPQIVYLGDPGLELTIPKHPDFNLKSSDINISPQNPLKDDTVIVSINIENLGVTFPNDSVLVELYKDDTNEPNLIGEIKIPSFGQKIQANIEWLPQEAGLYNLIAKVNEKEIIEEVDHSDNTASRSFTVFDFGEPNIIKPVNGYFTNNNTVDFIFSDIGFYFNRNFNYKIQINNSNEFNGSLLIESPVLNQKDGIVKWQSPLLQEGEYFWRAIIYDPIDTNYSSIRILTKTDNKGSGYFSNKKQLQLFELNNVYYSDTSNNLLLNTELKPPHPEEKFFLDSIMISLPADSTQPSTFTTDGTYFYFAHLPVWVDDSKVYKIGTGLNGTIAGENYGSIPGLSLKIYSHLFYKDGLLYTNIGSPKHILSINPQDGDTTSVSLTDSLLLTQQTSSQIGGYYFYYDGIYLYNLAMGTLIYPNKFVLRKFNSKDWSKVGEDIIFSGELIPAVTSFIVVNGYIILYENLYASHLRRYRLSDGFYEEEWAYAVPAKDFYAITYDYVHNYVYFSSFRPVLGTYEPGFIKYRGTYIEAQGSITSQAIGPASKWHDLQFEIDQTNSNGTYKAYLLGKNKNSGIWETMDTLNQSSASLQNISAAKYNYLQLNFDLVDSSFGAGEPMKFNSLKVNYDYLPEISMLPKNMTFAPDSMLQGIDVNMNLKINNYGYIPVDSLRLDFYLNEGDSIFFTKYISVQTDSFNVIDHVIKTDTNIFDTKIKAIASSPIEEYFTFNNLVENDFYIARDSVKPIFNITFDGQEILDGDIVSSRPEVVITLKDNTPLHWDESHFTIVYDNEPLDFTPDTLVFEQISPYPNSEVKVTWTPFIREDGEHTLEVLAKDPSGNFFDSTSYRVSFFVFNNFDIRDVYNYPNPFGDNTHFTFELRGVNVPEELRIRIFTIAGRMIKELKIPSSLLQIGFNSIYWDGKDHDGDEIANGLYFYKVIYKNNDVVKTVTQKLAKVK